MILDASTRLTFDVQPRQSKYRQSVYSTRASIINLMWILIRSAFGKVPYLNCSWSLGRLISAQDVPEQEQAISDD